MSSWFKRTALAAGLGERRVPRHASGATQAHHHGARHGAAEAAGQGGALMRRVLPAAFMFALLPAGAWSATNPHAVDVPGAIDHYCAKCHNTTDWAGNLALTELDPVVPSTRMPSTM